jgi:hypothetical protein
VTVIEIIRAVCSVTGIPRPSSVSGSSDTGVQQLLGLLNEEGQELAARGPWEALTQEKTFTTVAAESQGTLISLIGATNNYRYIVNDTIWNRTRRQKIVGTTGPALWQAHKAWGFEGIDLQYRIRGGELLFMQVPEAGETCAFEYITKNWLTDSGGTAFRSVVGDDEDVPRLDDEIITLGLKWRWLRRQGLDYAEEFRAYESRVVTALAKDATKQQLSLEGREHFADIPQAIPRLIGS